jgi:hypothetical protein
MASSGPFVVIFQAKDPTVNDTQYPIQKIWLNTITENFWFLKNFNKSGEITTANWIPISSAAVIETLTGNSGGPVPPDSSNTINVVGDGIYLTTVGDPGTNTLTIEPAGGFAALYTEDTGTAKPLAGNLNILGGTGITTSGAGDTVTITATGAGDIVGITVDASTPPGTNPVLPNGSGDIILTGNQVPAGTTANVIRTDSLADNTCTIEIQRSQAVASSTVGDNGVAHFNSAHFTVDSNAFVSLSPSVTPLSLNIQTFTTSGTYTPTSGMQYCIIELVGGGGGSGGVEGVAGDNAGATGGGGGAGYARGAFSASSIGASQTVTIGAGGTAGPAGNNDGGNGGTTSVGSLISASGGNGSHGVTASSGSNSSGGTGGTGTGGSVQITGGTGFGGGWDDQGAGNNIVISGYGGGTPFGTGAIGDFSGSSSPGIAPGGGAGGAATNTATSIAGAVGASGIVIITEYIT